MREVVRYIVQAKQADGSWKTIKNTKSYKTAVAVARRADNRRIMEQTILSDKAIYLADGFSGTYFEWQRQSDAERDARALARRQQ